ncbi:uncharacterized protein SAMN05444156_2425 [Verrucomicrobium sp. GAS474]|uniref:HD domain-containing protein n=1 Tax=Verrucomicrobium sp. GAS474 TaxID=1882831 RepID=UPI0008799A95|nr:HD domain-containing protein [Verrucomicrobium sp. GAS474]SDU17688.1 uncharacterized protein SAMN05444156_2425 [Verrucomicrobium sp. GAS474]
MSLATSSFAPHEALAAALLPHIDGAGDGAHDLAHLVRVWKNAFLIHAEEGGEAEVLAAATLLHDCVTVEKSSPLRSQASRLAAERAAAVLGSLGWPAERVEAVRHAVEAHSFTAALAPRTLEAKILQDADRLDAIGMIGVARCFYTAGRMASALYDPADPRARHRPRDDRRFALDHFEEKLLKLASGFQTSAGARMAATRQDRLRRFMEEFLDEVDLS